MSVRIIQGDCCEVLKTLPDESVHCVVTSPPYWGLRDYGVAGQLGLESTPAEYVEKMVAVFREVRRVLRDDGTLWLNLGDSYASGGRKSRDPGRSKIHPAFEGESYADGLRPADPEGIKPKDLIGIPWRVAFALQQPYRNWQIKTEAMRAWVGGIVDGEGCITIMETKSSHSESLSYPPIIQVRMCDLEPLDRLVQVVGSSYGKPQHPPSQVAANQRPSWQWKVVSEQAANVIAEIYPFLTCKRKQAIVAWNHQAFRSARGNGPRAQGDIEKEQFCKTLINKLNQREPVDIPSWMKEPTIVYEPGWFLRQDLIWSKPNPMPESVRDRCTKAHEYLFLLAKSERYYFDAEAIAEPLTASSIERLSQPTLAMQQGSDRVPGKTNGNMKAVGRKTGGNFSREYAEAQPGHGGMALERPEYETRNKRSVWTVATQPFNGSRFVDGADGDTGRIRSSDCPVHGDHCQSVSTVRNGGQPAVSRSARNQRTDARPVQSQQDALFPIETHHGEDCALDSSDSPARACAGSAIASSTQSHRTAHALETSPHGIGAAELAQSTADSGPQPLQAATSGHIRGSSSEPDASLDERQIDPSERTVQSSAGKCSCRIIDHFATFPPALIEPCILAGCPVGGTVLDPFGGAGTTGLVADRLGRNAILIELNESYCEMARKRIKNDAPMFAEVS